MTKWFKIILMMVMVVGFYNCNIFESDSTSGSVLIIGSITGKDLQGQEGSPVIFSDVLTNGGIVNDNATASLTAHCINPDVCGAASTYYQSIIVDQIDVEYSRSDGLAGEGEYVPYSFSQKVSMKIDIEETLSLPFVIVQHVAKLESPLVELINLGQEKILKLEARVTFNGYDVGGHRIQPVTGYISVWCSNFADE